MILPAANAPCLAHEPRNGPTCVLAVVVWLKLNHKYFNEGTAKEACDQFKVRAKQLSRVLTGRKYWVAHSQRNARPQRQQPPHKNLQPEERRPIHKRRQPTLVTYKS